MKSNRPPFAAAVILICSCLVCEYASAEAGGHDLFTSLVQLKEMWSNDRDFVKTLKSILPVMESFTDASKRLVFKKSFRYSKVD